MIKNDGIRPRCRLAAAFIFLACLFAVLAPSYSQAKGAAVAVLPWKVNSTENLDFVKEAMMDMLSSRIGAGEAEVMRADAVKAALAGEKAKDVSDAVALEAGKKLKADYVLYGSLTVLGQAVSLDARLLNVKDGSVTPFYSKASGMDSVIGMADKLSSDVLGAIAPGAPPVKQAPAAREERPAAATAAAAAPGAAEPAKENDFIVRPKEGSVKPVLWRSERMDGQYEAMAAADLDRDGVKELFILKSNSILIARIGADKLETIKEIKGVTGGRNVAITAIDSDADGSPEVYVSAMVDNRPQGYVIEFKDNDYRVTITGIKWLMKTAGTKGGPALIGQSFRRPDGFYGPVVALKKEGNAIVEKGRFLEKPLPGRMDIYRFETVGDSKDVDVIALDKRDFLRFYKKDMDGNWQEVLKSNDFFGGTLNNIEITDEDRPGSAEAEPFPVEGRFFVTDLNKDKRPELIIKRNIPGGLGRYGKTTRTFTSGYVLDLSIEQEDVASGGFLTENWRTKEINGYISDFFIDELAAGGGKELVMLVVEGTGLFTGNIKSYILLSRLSI